MASSRNGPGKLARFFSSLRALVSGETLPVEPRRPARPSGLWSMLTSRERLPTVVAPVGTRRPGLLRLLFGREQLPPAPPAHGSRPTLWRWLTERESLPKPRGDN